VFGLHVSSDIPAGKIAIHQPGPGSAASDRFRIVIQGKGGHAARPQAAVDTVAIAAQVITALQTLVSRETDPTKAAVVSTTAVIAGEAFNVLPDTAELRGTVRTLDPDTRELMASRIVELVEGIATAMRATADVQFIRGYPGIVNDAEATRVVQQAARSVVGDDNVIEARLGLGGEDFAYFSLERPGCFFRAGTRNEDRGIVWGHHHPRFDVEEDGFAAGLGTMVQTAIGFLNR
jgi:amidohydrolase